MQSSMFQAADQEIYVCPEKDFIRLVHGTDSARSFFPVKLFIFRLGWYSGCAATYVLIMLCVRFWTYGLCERSLSRPSTKTDQDRLDTQNFQSSDHAGELVHQRSKVVN